MQATTRRPQNRTSVLDILDIVLDTGEGNLRVGRSLVSQSLPPFPKTCTLNNTDSLKQSIPMAADQHPDDAFQILSLDGGGIKGVFSAALLAAIEEDLGCTIIDHFDLIAGTSTGGIIALGLGLGLTPKQIVEFYIKYGRNIFSNKWHHRGLQHWFYRKYPSKALEEALKASFGDKLFGDSHKRLVVPSYNLGEDEVYIFRTPHHQRLKRDFRVPAWKVGMATSAAPTFFSAFRGVGSVRLVDGGVWANNPTMVGIVEATSTLDVSLRSIKVLNIGTTDEVSRRSSRLNSGGILTWASEKAVIDVIMRGQSIAAYNQAIHLLGRDKIIRLSPTVARSEFLLDGHDRTDDLIGKAAHYSRTFTPQFQQEFGGHKAKPYVSLN